MAARMASALSARQIPLLLGALLAATTLLAESPNQAHALCSGHALEHGDWVNADPNTRAIARIELRDCQSVTTCSGSTCSTTHDAGWTCASSASARPRTETGPRGPREGRVVQARLSEAFATPARTLSGLACAASNGFAGPIALAVPGMTARSRAHLRARPRTG